MSICPKGHGLLVRTCDGWFCLSCGYEEGTDDFPDVEAEVMASAPGTPTTRLGRYEEEIYRRDQQEWWANDLKLAEEAAARHGVSLEDLRVKMHWKITPLSTRNALQDVIEDLTVSGLGLGRVGRVLGKSPRTISQSPGLGRGRARRNHD